MQKPFYLGKGFSIFTSELYAILMASYYICNIQLAIFNSLMCVDSKSVLYALKNWDCKMRTDIFYEVMYFMHCTMSRGIGIQFCWVPSHCGLYWNEKYHTNHLNKTQWKTRPKHCTINLQLSSHGVTSIPEKTVKKELERKKICDAFLFKVFSKSNIQVTSKFMEH